MPSSFYVLLFLGLASLVFLAFKTGHRPKDYPPGPPTLPLVGNIHQMPAKDMHLQFQKWAQEYGPIYSLILGTRVMIVLSSAEVIKDLMDKRSAIYSDRLDHYVPQTLVSGGMRLLLMVSRSLFPSILL